jgi:hypothetical protein
VSARPTLITCAVVAALGVAALLAGAAGNERWTAFSLDVPPSGPAAILRSGEQVCAGGLEAKAGFGSVRAWVTPLAAPGASLSMRVRAAAGATLASARIAQGYGTPIAPTFRLTRIVPAGRVVSVCIRSGGPKRVAVLGFQSSIALLFLRRHPESLLSLLPTVFARAALFRPAWVGPWTFWLLLGGLLAGLVVGAIAVLGAVRSDARAAGDMGSSRQ